MDWSIVLFALVLILFLIGLSGVLSALESASLTANRQVLRTLEAAGDPSASEALAMLANTRRILAGSLTGTLFAPILAAGLLKMLLAQVLPRVFVADTLPPGLWWVASSTLWTFLLLPPLFLVLSEWLPRQWSRQHPDSFLRISAMKVRWLAAWWFPVAEFLARLLSFGLRRIGLQGGLEPVRLTRQDLRDLLEEPTEVAEAASPGTQRGMIRSILSLGGTLAREVMIPLGQVMAIRLGEMSPTQALAFARRHRYTRYPVYRERMIDLIGFINIYDLLSEDLENARLEDFIHEALFMPETARVDVLLHEFIRHKTQCAIVFDEHGTCSGWVTREDVLEEIVGDLDIEGDPALLRIRKEDDGIFSLDPEMDIDDLNRLLDISLEKLHSDTVGGYVYSVLGRVPLPGERIYLRRWILEVVEMDRHIIRSLRLLRRPEKLSAPEDEDEAE